MNTTTNYSDNFLFIQPNLKNLVALTHQARQLSEKFQSHTATPDDLKTMGSQLWETIQIDLEATPLTPKRIVIDSDNMAVQNLPWECLYHPQIGFLGRHPDYTVARQMLTKDTQIFQNVPTVPVGPLNILLFTTQPENIPQQPLETDVEQHAVRTTLAPWIKQGWVHLYAPDDGRFATLVELLNTQEWHLVLLSGHTLFTSPATSHQSHYPLSAIRYPLSAIRYPLSAIRYPLSAILYPLSSQAFLIFESDDGTGEAVTMHQLVDAFQDSLVQCVVIAACQSGKCLEPGETNLSFSLTQAGLPHVIGMRESLVDRAGCVFVQAFCQALAQQAPVDLAVQQGRRAMLILLKENEVWQTHRHETQVDHSVRQWSVPMLLTRDPTRPLVNWNFTPTARPPRCVGKTGDLSPKLFIGRRRELRILGEALRCGKITKLLIRGEGGIGKTALAGQLVTTLTELGYRVLFYPLPKGSELESYLSTFATEHWIIWWDGWEPGFEGDVDKAVELERISGYLGNRPRMLLTSRVSIPHANDFSEYCLTCPEYHDFWRYTRQLGLPHPDLQIRWIYEVLHGNFKGVQLLQSLPTCTQAQGLKTQLALVRRYLRAYSQ